MNRYSVHEPEMSHATGHSYGMAPLRSASSRSSSYVTSPSSRYTSIYEESARENNFLSPTSSRRTNPLSDSTTGTTTRRESTFYGMPSSRDSSLSRRDAGASSSSYFVRGSSSGMDATSTSYATMRPSFMRYRR